MKKLVFIFGASLFIFGKCNKNSDVNTPGAAFTVLTSGSNWTYRNTNGATVTNYKLTATGGDTVVNGKTYKILANNNGPNNYQYTNAGLYYRYGVLAGLTAAGGLEELYLKDEAVNSTWNAVVPINFGGTALNVNTVYTIKEKETTKTVGALSFTGVTKVRLDLSATLPLIGTINIGGGDFFYARGVGMIQFTIAVTVPGQPAINQSTDLIAYEIK